jgi:hypothetical protein
MRDAVDAAAANAKVAASQRAERIRANIAILDQHAEHPAPVRGRGAAGTQQGAGRPANLVAARIREHQEREAARLERERERIRQEEAARLERERRDEEARIERERQKEIEAAKAIQPDTTPTAVVSTIPQQPAAQPAPVAVDRPGTQIKLGDINAALAPLSISAEGLATIGFKPVASRGAAKLYAGADFPAICDALAQDRGQGAVPRDALGGRVVQRVAPSTKVCNRCSRDLALTMFHPRTKGGLENTCRQCRGADMQRRRRDAVDPPKHEPDPLNLALRNWPR